MLHQDNAPPHTAICVAEFLAEKSIPVVPHPPYSPDLAPCDFWLFPKMKMKMKGNRYDEREDIIDAGTAVLNELTESDFQECFRTWEKRINSCVEAKGQYFEGD